MRSMLSLKASSMRISSTLKMIRGTTGERCSDTDLKLVHLKLRLDNLRKKRNHRVKLLDFAPGKIVTHSTGQEVTKNVD